MIGHLLVFVGVSALVITTPGPDTALTVRNALTGRRRRGVQTAAGVATGQLAWTLATAFGLAALIAASRPAFEALHLFGAAYLLYLGLKSLWSAVRPTPPSAPGAAGTTRAPAGRRAFLQGLTNDLGNPKMAGFFLSLFPQFAPGGDIAATLVLGAVFAVMTFLWLSLYAVVLDRARGIFTRARPKRILDAISGLVLVGFGTRVALES